jgi:hypothetical protein
MLLFLQLKSLSNQYYFTPPLHGQAGIHGGVVQEMYE